MKLKIAAIHMSIVHGDAKGNRQRLLQEIGETAKKGANIIVTPEMAVSGYSFKSRAEIAPHVDEMEGKFHRQITAIAREFRCFICLGTALRCAKTDIYYNAARIYGPEGHLLDYHKINGEMSWAGHGSVGQNNVFETPWGKAGVLICSDTYYGLNVRATVLKGAELLLVLANWPPSGLDPVEVWQGRVLENGVPLVACNRTGQDKIMECTEAESCCIDKHGEIIGRLSARGTEVFCWELPLEEGKLESDKRKERLGLRRAQYYHSCYRDLDILTDITSFFELPDPGEMQLVCLSPCSGNIFSRIDEILSKCPGLPAFFLLPACNSLEESYAEQLCKHARDRRVCHAIYQKDNKEWLLMGSEGNLQKLYSGSWPPEKALQIPQVDVDSARVAFIPEGGLTQPELVLSLSKEGCDLIVTSTEIWNEETVLLAGIRSIDRAAIVVAGDEQAGVWLPPQGHQRWREYRTDENSMTKVTINTKALRNKGYQSRVDCAALFEH